jgi:CheY-like chemotaxis protein
MNSKRVLIVEDEPITLMDEIELVSSLGHTVVGTAVSANSAIERAEQTLPDVVLMDILLSGSKSGLDAALEIRGRLKIPVIFVSALGDKASFARPTNMPANSRYIVKPYTRRELADAIAEVTSPRATKS